MLTNYVKRILSFALALVLVLGMLPVQALATGEEHVHNGDTCETVEHLREMMAEAVEMCGANADMTDDELLEAFFCLNDEQVETILENYEVGFELAESLTDEEAALLGEEENTKVVLRLYDLLNSFETPTLYASGYNLTEGVTASVSGASAENLTDGVLSVTASGTTSGGGCDPETHANGTATITITNGTDGSVKLSFQWNVTTGSVGINGVTQSGNSGTGTLILDAGASGTVTVTTAEAGKDKKGTVNLSGFAIETVADAVNATVSYDSTLGSVTINGEAAVSGEAMEVSTSAATSFVATASGSSFLGWTDENGAILSTSAQYDVKIGVDTAVKAVFAKDGGNAVFALGTTSQKSSSETFLGQGTDFVYSTVSRTHLFDDLTAALAAAQSGNSKAVVLMNNGTITGNYTIPSGVTLLIPCDDAGTLSTTNPVCANAGGPGVSGAYRTLTMASGSSITIANGGAMNVNAKLYAIGGSKRGGGSPLGAYGYMKMQDKSTITVQGGGNLYCYGYINGTGSVTVNSQGKVYEVFQFEDFRGGSATSAMSQDTEHGVFPLSAYYVQNVMVPLTLETGATEGSYASLHMNSATFGTAVEFISDKNAMFNLKNGSVTKRYDHATDRLIFDVDGEVEIAGITMGISSITMKSSDFVLPINSNMTININSGSISLQQEIALLPGAEVNIGEDAVCTLVESGKLYLYDSEDWGNFVSSNPTPFLPAYHVPERQHTMTVAELKDAQILVKGDVTANGPVYTTSSGAAIQGTEGAVIYMTPATSGATYQAVYVNDSKKDYVDLHEYSYANGKLAPAMLKNAEDGSYYKTADTPKDGDAYVVGRYEYTNGAWNFVCNEHKLTGIFNCGISNECTVCGYIHEAATGDHPADQIHAATCTSGRVCDACGQEIDEPLGHDYKTVAAKADECREGVTGYKESYICQRAECGLYLSDKEGTVIGDQDAWTAWTMDPNGGMVDDVEHTWGTPQKTKDPTCTEPGNNKYTCVVCGGTKNEEIPALGHKPLTVEGVPVSCTTNGSKEYHVCQNTGCGLYFEDVECTVQITEDINTWKVIPATGHQNLTEHVEDPATCLKSGVEAYWECACGELFSDAAAQNAIDAPVPIPQLDHNIVVDQPVAPTCESTGLKQGSHCTTCDTQTIVQEEIPALGHKWTGATTEWVEKEGVWYGVASAYCQNDTAHTLNEEVAGVKSDELSTAPGCEKAGKDVYTATFENKDVFTLANKEIAVSALTHQWDTTYQWEKVGSSWVCSATAVCQNDSSHTRTEDAIGELNTDAHVAPDCLNPGKDVYDATFAVYPEIFTGDAYEVELPALGHSFGTGVEEKNATCTVDGNVAYWYCSVCDKNYGDNNKDSTNVLETVVVAAAGHIFGEQVAAKDATCTEKGNVAYYHCANCELNYADNASMTEDEIKDVEIAATGHSYETNPDQAWIEETAPTCLTDGSEYRVCTNADCGEKQTQPIGATGHSFGDQVAAKDATCTENGNVAYYTCGNCGKNFEDNIKDTDKEIVNVVIEAEGHKLTEMAEVPASCVADGKEAHFFCSVCEKNFQGESAEALKMAPVADAVSNEDLIIAKGEHHFAEIKDAKDATCLEDGNKAYWFCDGCGIYYADAAGAAAHKDQDGNPVKDVAGVTLTATGHNMTYHAAVPSGCTTDGNIEYWSCDRCNKNYAEDGAFCAKVLVSVVDPADGHVLTYHAAVAPDCTTDGNIEYWQCSVCGKNYAEEDTAATEELKSVVDPALKHQIVRVPYQAATCEANGVYEHYKCERTDCGELFKDANGSEAFVGETVIPKRVHDIEEVANSGKAATCLDAGWKAHYACTYSDCGKLFADANGTEIADLDTWRSEGNNGWIQPAGHQNIAPVAAKAANCEVSGTKAYWTCGVCHVNYADAECTEANKIGDTAALNAWLTTGEGFIASTGHAWGEGIVTKDPTCYDDGIRTFTCANANCPVGTKTEAEKTQGHKGNVVTGQAATCTVDGWKDYYYCAGCDTNYEDQACTVEINTDIGSWQIGNGRIPATDHDWEADADAYTAPTCVTAGSQGYVCKNDAAHTKTETIDALGHKNVTATEKQDATCDADGHQAYWTCGVCQISYFAISMGESVKIGDAEALNLWLTEGNGKIGKLNHPEVKLIEKVAPGCSTAGVKEHYKCTKCDTYFSDADKTLIENIDAWKAEGGEGYLAPEHKLAETIIQEADCTTDGYKAVNCTVKGCGYRAFVDIPALGHNMQPVAAQDPTCTEPGISSGTLKCTRCDETDTSGAAEELPALGHIYQLVENSGKDATCTENGWNAHYECVREDCDMIFDAEKGNVIEDLDAWRADAGKIPAIDHKDANKIPGKEPDCVNEGLNPYWYCADCGKYFSDEACDNVIDDLDAWKTGDGKIAALGHDQNQIAYTAAKDPTCTTTGTKAYWTCGVCGISYSDAECTEANKIGDTAKLAQWLTVEGQGLVKAKGHDWNSGEITTEPTCTAPGKKTYTCKNDTSHTYNETVSATGHVTLTAFERKEPTCEIAGHEAYWQCICNKLFSDAEAKNQISAPVVIPATGHTGVINAAKAPTCDKPGYKAYYMCSGCGVFYETADCAEAGKIGDAAALAIWQTTGKGVIPATDHDWEKSDVYTAPTCTEPGSQGYVCKNDPSHTKNEPIKATGHSKQLNFVDGQAADCENAGWKGYYCCTNAGCDALFADVTGNTPITLADWKAGEGKIPANGHAYALVEGSAKAATCIEDGWNAHYQCTTSGCGKIFDAVDGNVIEDLDAWQKGAGKIAAAGHNLTYHEAVASDCTTDGNIEYWSCSECGKNFGADDKFAAEALDSIVDAADGHVLTHHKAVDAGCITDGNIEYWNCSACGKNFATDDQFAVEALDKVVVEATGHTLTYHKAVASDCTNDGNIEYWSCSECDKNFGSDDKFAAEALDSIVDAADGHNLTHYKAVEAGCITDGNIEYWNCSACGKNFAADDQFAVEALDKVVVEATGHTLTYHAAVASGCTTDGNIEYWSCSECDKNFGSDDKFAAEALDSIVDAADGHQLTHQEAVDASCTSSGHHAYWYCSTCKVYFKNAEATETFENNSPIIPATGHTEETIPGKAPTCTVRGYTDGKKCSVCGEVLVEREPILATGHKNGEPTRENEVAPSCTENGSYDEVVKCTVCGEEVSRTAKTVPATGHITLTAVERKAPDCKNAGYEAYWKCSCNKLFSDAEAKNQISVPVAIPATGHKEVIDEAKAPTCTETGLTEGKHCSVCGEVTIKQTEVAAKGHTEVIDKAVAVTCTVDGKTEGKHCSVCGEITVAQKVIKAQGHIEETLPPVDPDCENTGLTEGKKCSTCGEILIAQEKIDALGHTEVTDEAKAPTCTETGLTEGKHCSVCDKVLVPQDNIPAKGHKVIYDGKVDPTCTEPGKTEGSHCDVCGVVLVEQTEVPAKGHTGSLVQGVAAKCDLDGWKDYYQCKDCKLFFMDEACTQPIENLTQWRTEGEGKLPMLGHSWNNGIVTTLSTCDVEGVRTFTCNTCNRTKTEAEPVLGHDPEYHEAQHPTYYSVGWEAYETCKRPDCEYSSMVGIPALGEPSVNTYEDFMFSLKLLEGYANDYAKANPGKDPMLLLIKYVRTGVDRYNSGSWNIMAGYEDEGFAEYVKAQEEAYNKAVPTIEEMINVTGIKNIGGFDLPNGQEVDFGHMFGTMDITYHNKTSINHADVSGWAGDLVDLLSTADRHDVTGTVDAMIKEIGDTYLNHSIPGESDQFSRTDMYGDLDGYYFMNEIIGKDYENGMLYGLMEDYFVASLTDEQRADYFLKNRLGGVTGRNEIREAVFNEYLGNSVIATLEGTREFKQSDISDLRKACCYAFADYMCYLAGDYVELGENPYFTVFSTELSTLAPGITQQISKATTADGKQVVYYTATADVTSPYVNVYANYKDNDPTKGWGMQRVMDQANAAQAKYGDPNSDQYIENFNVIAAINGSGYNMTTGEPSGVLMMGGVEYHAPSGGFVGFLKDGSCYMGSDAEYYALKEQGLIRDAISMFGTTLVKDGKIAVNAGGAYFNDRASRTAIGVTKTGKVVFMVMDGRQEPVSCGGSAVEIAQVMLEAGCVHAINLDGGGSTTYVARQPGDDALSLVSSPSDGFQRSVSTSLYMASTAPSSTAFDHAVLDSEYRHMTIGASVQVTAAGVSATGNPAELPEGATWAVSNANVASISEDGLVTALANGKVDVYLMVDDEIVGTRTLNVVVPDAVYFTKENMNAIYGVKTDLPVAALFEGKPVAILEKDATFSLSNPAAGTTEGFTFTGIEESGIKTVKIFAHATNNPNATSGSMGINMFRADEASFDFENVDGGDRLLAYNRVVSNSTTADSVTYTIVDHEKPMVTEYSFGMDMTQIPIPEQLSSLVYMLPGADVEGNNSAWDFLLQLAERVSVLTEVRATLKLDPQFDVDYSELSVNCEYFILDQTEFNPETNELTLVLHWKDQTKAIDPNTANPLVILAGIKLTPKADADWGAKDRITAVNSGEISYDIYLRANALYSFASKPENQLAFGLLPFDNQDVIIGGATEKGGHFQDVYKEFSDEYTLNKGLPNGWVYEEGGYAYYEDGAKYTGIQKVGQFYYDFGSTGINMGQTKYTGMFQIEGINHYAKEGLLSGGWYIDKAENKYYFDETGKAVNGEFTIDEVKMTFENGLLTGGHSGFLTKTNGNTYYYQNGSMFYGWLELDGKWYCFDETNGIMTVGNGTPETKLFPTQEAKAKGAYYVFNEQGHALYVFPNNYGYYYWADLPVNNQWVRNGYDLDGWYHTNEFGKFVTTPNAADTFQLTLGDKTYTAVKIAYDGVVYTFDNSCGKLLLGSMVYENGQWFYYWAGAPVNNGWFTFNGDTYYAFSDGHLATGSVIIEGEDYMFTPQGVLITEGIMINASVSEDNKTMNVKVLNADEKMTAARMAMWAVNAGQAPTMQWHDLVKQDDGTWTAKVSLCSFGLEENDSFEMHVYGTVDEQEALIVNTTVADVAPAEHTYTDAKDPTCDLCGFEREIVEEPEQPEQPEEPAEIPTTPMYRLFNPNTGEHFYTGSTEERDMLVEAGWNYEGIAWNAPIYTGAPVYRVFNPNSGDHHYTMSQEEVDMLVELGWQYEGVAWNSAPVDHPEAVAQFRLYNPNADIGSHHYTSSTEECDTLVALGWKLEGIGWFGLLK